MREYCSKCQRLIQSCFCKLIVPLDNIKHVIILQHPSEESHILGTAKIAELTLSRVSVFKGEIFSQNKELQERLNTSKPALFRPNSQSFVYEEKKELFDTLIFLDGTWKKANKIYFLNPFLQKIPNVSFKETSISKYRLRKEPKESYLSTFEAILKACEADHSQNLDKHLAPLEFIQRFQESYFKREI